MEWTDDYYDDDDTDDNAAEEGDPMYCPFCGTHIDSAGELWQ